MSEEKELKTMFSFNLGVELKNKLIKIGNKRGKKLGPLLNFIAERYVEDVLGVEADEEKVILKKQQEEIVRTPQEIKDEWDFRINQVARGELPTYMTEQFPQCNRSPELEDIYLTPDGKPRNRRLFGNETLEEVMQYKVSPYQETDDVIAKRESEQRLEMERLKMEEQEKEIIRKEKEAEEIDF